MEVNYAIEKTKKIIDSQIGTGKYEISEGLKGYRKGYFITNEDIKAYLDLTSFDGKDTALSVLASGDQAFSLISKGILNIDTFDINELQPYIALGLKRAMILKYSYEEYLTAINKLSNNCFTTLEEISSIVFDLLPYMEEEYRVFWKNIIDYNYQVQKELKNQTHPIRLLTIINSTIVSEYPNNVPFLESKEKYNELKNTLSRVNISFKPVNAYNLANYFPFKYDFILLSNILDYFYHCFGTWWDYSKLHDYENTLMPLLKEDGVIFLHYIFEYYLGKVFTPRLFFSSTVYPDNLQDEELIILNSNGDKNGIILKR